MIDQDQQYADVVESERSRTEDAAIRIVKTVLLASTLDIIASILSKPGSDSLSVVTSRAGNRLEDGLHHGLIASWLTGRQRSMIQGAVHEQHAQTAEIPAPKVMAPTGVIRIAESASSPLAPILDPVGIGAGVFNRGDGVGGLARPSRRLIPVGAASPAGGGSGSGAGRVGGSGGGGSSGPRIPVGGSSAPQPRPLSVNQIAKKFHEARLNLSQDQIKALGLRYGQAARTISGEVGGQLNKAALKIAGELIENPLTTDSAAAYIKERLGKMGLSHARPYAVETIWRTAMLTAYNAGQWEFDQDPAIQEILWGYTYVTVGDDRVCPICEPLEGITRPVHDPVWDTAAPPNHFACRCILRGVMKGSESAKPSDIPDGATDAIPKDFAVNWGKVYRTITQ